MLHFQGHNKHTKFHFKRLHKFKIIERIDVKYIKKLDL